MSEAKHTPGPWNIRHSSDGSGDFGIAAGGNVLAECFAAIRHLNERSPEAFANARLIAAAPDMIDAIRQWQSAERDGDEREMANARSSRDAAIARAEGKQP
jgi:hypothetical protein